MLRRGDWTPEAERWEFARRQMFKGECDVRTLHSRIRHLLETWPTNQGSPPVPLRLMDRALRDWPKIWTMLVAEDEVRQVDIAKRLELDAEGKAALSYLMYVFSGCGVVRKRTVKNRVRLQLQNEEIDLAALKTHWHDAWGSRTSFELTRPMYRDLDPNDDAAIADLLVRDGPEVFKRNASPEAVETLTVIETGLKRLSEAADGSTALFWHDLPRSWQRILSWLEAAKLVREMQQQKRS